MRAAPTTCFSETAQDTAQREGGPLGIGDAFGPLVALPLDPVAVSVTIEPTGTMLAGCRSAEALRRLARCTRTCSTSASTARPDPSS